MLVSYALQMHSQAYDTRDMSPQQNETYHSERFHQWAAQEVILERPIVELELYSTFKKHCPVITYSIHPRFVKLLWNNLVCFEYEFIFLHSVIVDWRRLFTTIYTWCIYHTMGDCTITVMAFQFCNVFFRKSEIIQAKTSWVIFNFISTLLLKRGQLSPFLLQLICNFFLLFNYSFSTFTIVFVMREFRNGRLS